MERMPQSHETTGEATIELPKTSPDRMTGFYLREIQRAGKGAEVENYLNQQLNNETGGYDTAEDFLAANPNYFSQIDDAVTNEQKDALRNYSSWNFAWINSVERNQWDYEKLGRQTPEKLAAIRETADKIDQAIISAPVPKESFTTVRGTDLSAFQKFNIHSLNELEQMQGQMMVESGFVSTALNRELSFVDRGNTLWIGEGNIEMHYRIPAGYKTSIAMLREDLSLSPEQTEVLINRGMLSYVSKVELDETGTHAKMDVVIVPSELYDPLRVEKEH
jgi:hypothetical protein